MHTLSGDDFDGDSRSRGIPGSDDAPTSNDATSVSLRELLRLGQQDHQREIDKLVAQHNTPRRSRTTSFVVKSAVVWSVWVTCMLFTAWLVPETLAVVGPASFGTAFSTWVLFVRGWHV
ncbi:hypothetical protein [Actinokineospora bangkokensis]|uniref:Uncharacterized protein n=1 Tax=Actinokineospora bangkokensis TaxID=1193682 RepID=A0A1Q9LC01_9PSEU|nr:hypothetical protein [Actinokineospora bangkokensis]OLR89544.1 hypothetical protein BJP25_05565 [Actinokineospora bangkokensis]